MNPDGSNQRQVTAELVPVSGFDVSGDGNTIAYGAGGVVKRMGIGGDNLQTLTANGSFEYAPAFIPDGTALVVGRRDSRGADQGYWRIPLVSGADQKQVVPSGAPGLGSVALRGEGLTGTAGEPAWAPRAAFSADGTSMLVVLGSDNTVELVDMTGARQPVKLSLAGNSRPVWDLIDNAFYVAATPDQGLIWSYWRVSVSGATIRIGPAAGDLTTSLDGRMAFTVLAADGSTHLAFTASAANGNVGLLTNDPTWSEFSPSFSPDGSTIVFGRFGAASPTASAGIWIIRPDGTELTNLAIDGAYPRWLP
jgi:Tol biopolymer transport system component